VLKKEMNWKGWGPDCDKKPKIEQRFRSPGHGNESSGADNVVTLTILRGTH